MNTVLKKRNSAHHKNRFWKFLSHHNYLISFMALFIVATIIDPIFLTSVNLSTMLKQAAIIGIIALGMNIVIIEGMIDLSVGSIVALAAGLGVVVLNNTNSMLWMLLFCLALATVLGLINGLLVTKGRIPAFIVTLATMVAYRSIIVQLGQGGPFNVNVENYDDFFMIAAGETLYIPNLGIIFVIITVGITIMINYTKFGRDVYAVGSNEQAAKLAGINVDDIKTMSFVITGFLCGVSAFLLASRLSAITAPNAGMGFELDAIAAVAIGGTSMTGGRGKIAGAFLGAIMLQMINNILVIANISSFLEGLVKGVILILAVLLQSRRLK